MKFKDIIKKESSDFNYYRRISKDYQQTLKNIERSKKWGIFIWNRTNKYPKKDAIKIYTSKKRAENALEKMEKFNYVVRYFFDG